MAQFQPPLVFSPGDILTAADLNAHVSSAILLPGSINDQTAVTAFDIQSTDTFNIYDSSGAVLRQASVDDLMRSGMIAKFDSISGKAGQNLAITPAAGYAVAINGDLTTSGSLNIGTTSIFNGTVTVVNSFAVLGALPTFNSTDALKIPVGTTVQRPASPATGQIRYNSTISATEVYNGTSWDAVPVAGTNLTLPNTVNFTGTIQYNGTAVYSLSAISEETIPSATGSGVLWTSSAFTKPSDEIWVFEVDTLLSTGGVVSLEFLNTSGVAYNVFKVTGVSVTSVFSKWVVNTGTTLTVETLRINALLNSQTIGTAGGSNKFRIYKYRTA